MYRAADERGVSQGSDARTSEALLRERCHRAASVLGFVVAAIGAAVFAGWVFNLEPLKRIHPSLVTMKPNTALCFILMGFAVRLQSGNPSILAVRLAQVFTVPVAMVGALSFLQHTLSFNAGIDELLFSETVAGAGRSVPGRMAPATGLNFLLLSIAVFLLRNEGHRAYRWISSLTLAATGVTLLAFIVYFYGSATLHDLPLMATIALHTVATFLLLASAILLTRPGEGVVAIMTRDSPSGVLARRLLPTAVLLPVLFGWATLAGSKVGWFTLPVGIAGFAVVLVAIFTALVWNAAATVERLDAQRWRNAQRLRESEQRFELLANSTPVLMWVNDLGGCQFVNRAYAEFFGRPEEDLLGRGWEEFVHPDDRTQYMERYKAAAKHQANFNTEVRLRRHDGEYRWVLSTGVPRILPSGQCIGYVGSSVDITDIVHARESLMQHRAELETMVKERTARLREIVGELEAFSYSISHDMRAPLRAMSSYSGILLDEYGPKIGPEGAALLEKIRQASGRLDRLITDVLAYSRVVRADIDLHPVDADQLLRDLIEQYPEWQAPRAEITVHGSISRVLANEALLSQCITNLIGNAVKFVPAGTVPQVRISPELSVLEGAPAVKISFRDNGIGIDRADQARIFEVFERVHGPEYEGTGIGLSIVRKAVERMGGEFGLESQANAGSTFWIKLRKAD